MARDYILRRGGKEQEDSIPFHYQPGDKFAVVGRGEFEVVKAGNPKFTSHALVKQGKQHFLYHFATGDLAVMEDNQRCADCGQFACECNATNSKPNIHMDNVTVRDLAAYQNEQPIAAFRGTLLKVFEPKPEAQYPRWNGYIKDDNGDEHYISFCQKHAPDKSKVGKKVELSCYNGQKGMSGLKLKVEKGKDGKEYRKIWITDTCNVNWIGAAASSPPSKKEPTNTSATPGTQPSRAVQDDSTVEERVSLYIRIYDEVVNQAGDRFDPAIAKDVATHISMTFRGDYGSYAKPVFGGTTPVQTGDAKDEQEEDQQEQEQVPSWRDVVHAKKKKTLGEIAEEDSQLFDRLVAWAYSGEASTKDEQHLKASLLVAASELGLTAGQVVENLRDAHEEWGSGFNYDDFAEGFEQVSGTAFAEASEDELITQLGDECEEVIEAALKIGKARIEAEAKAAAAAKKTSASPAKKGKSKLPA